MAEHFAYGDDTLSPGLALELARGTRKGVLSPAGRERVLASRRQVRDIVAGGTTVYGINTGFGPLCDTKISEEETRILQTNILKSHSVGMGEPVPEVARQ